MEAPLLGDRFRRGQRTARGRRGELFAGVDTRDDHPCQIEVIAASGYRVEDLASELDREVALAERLPDSCLEARGWGHMAPDILFVARRWLSGLRPLDLQSGPVEARIQRLVRLAEHVQNLHRVGIVHRDVSFLSALQTDQEVFLSGLRFAKAEGLAEPPPDARGFELSYLPCAAPEVLEEPETADARADVFSLGVLLHMVLAGLPPYPGPTLVHLIRQHEQVRAGAAIPIAPQVPDSIGEVCRRSVAPEAADRFENVSGFLTALQKALGGAGLAGPVARPTPTPAPAPALASEPEPEPEPAAPAAAESAEAGEANLHDPFASDEGAIPIELLMRPKLEEAAPAKPAPSAPAAEPAAGGWGAAAAGPVTTPPASGGWGAAAAGQVSPPAPGGWGAAASGAQPTEEPEDELEEAALSPAEALALLEAHTQGSAIEDEVTEVVPALPDEPLEPPPDEPTDEFEPLPDISDGESDSGRLEASVEDSGSDIQPVSWLADAEREAGGDDRPVTSSWVAQADLGESSEEQPALPEEPGPFGAAEQAPGPFAEAQTSAAMTPTDALAALDAAVAAAGDTMEFESGEDLGQLDLIDDAPPDELILEDPGPPVTIGAPAPPPPPPSLPAPAPLPSLPELPTLAPPEPEPEPEPEPDPDPQPPGDFDFVEQMPPALVLRMPKGTFEPQVFCARAVVVEGFEHALLDLTGLNHLSGDQMGALTAIRSACERKSLNVAMFGLSKQVRFITSMMADMELPPTLEAVDAATALEEIASRS